ncbi:MAG: hypothetical protein KKE62_01795 [Proteobacteria bacterium]|nr:hypothetical protein [Pseudomonadota bacterium]MBU1387129.1 hypothetical protein [Pseudomonadota bacterium]MBU1541554.1 hypothetical protein [Pseudomonadota bacterium]MBU2429745.1 hypothetical protein [Pseudomonadota bacterium]MBU2482776.1 hypothetical protein [Pseudomonadota bacterium]
MIYIDFEGKTPVDNNLPNWKPWSQEKWNAWLAKSAELLAELEKLSEVGDIKERNDFIDSKSAHWGKLKPWLQALSKGKCWFSEVRELYSYYDVEHFRPKKEAIDINGFKRDGYWWLAFDYSNFRLCGNVGNRKKGGWFPLKDTSYCSTYDLQCEESEECYLLDPTDLNDVALIAFNEEGNAIIVPDNEISEWDKQRVEVSIKRLKLNEHEALTEERKKIWQKVSQEIDLFLKSKSRCSNGGNPAAMGKMKEHARNIRKMSRSESELSSVAKWCVLFRNNC